MFGLSKREISQRIADKIINDLKEKGYIRLEHVGILKYDMENDRVVFKEDSGLLDELKER